MWPLIKTLLPAFGLTKEISIPGLARPVRTGSFPGRLRVVPKSKEIWKRPERTLCVDTVSLPLWVDSVSRDVKRIPHGIENRRWQRDEMASAFSIDAVFGQVLIN